MSEVTTIIGNIKIYSGMCPDNMAEVDEGKCIAVFPVSGKTQSALPNSSSDVWRGVDRCSGSVTYSQFAGGKTKCIRGYYDR